MAPKSPQWGDPFVQFGMGAFETMRCIDGQIPLIEFHLERLSQALQIWNCTDFDLKQAWNFYQKTLPESDQFRVKWLLGLNLNHQISDHLFREPYRMPAKKLTCLALPAPYSTHQRYKSNSYDQHWLANRKATQHKCDDAIYLLPDSRIVECSRASVLITDSQKGYSAKGPNLNSVSVAALKKFNLEFWSERKIYLNQIASSEQLWACNALHGIRPISSVIDLEGKEIYRSNCEQEAKAWNEALFGLPS